MASFVVYGDTSGQVTVAAPAVAGSNTITFPAQSGTLITTASTTMPNTIVWDTAVKTSGFTAAIDSGNFCNTTGGAFTVTLPAAPTRGDFVVILDYAGTSATNNIIVSGNGANIKGESGNAVLSTNRQGITFTYIDSTQGWLATSNVYGGATPFTQQIPISYLVVAGGAGGGNLQGGGGGAGGFKSGTESLFATQTYTVTVGGGGAGGTSGSTPGVDGSNSSLSGTGITTVTSTGGGGGGTNSGTTNGKNGGSGGGGGGANATTGGTGTSGQGNNGGNGSPSVPNYGGGGGGGAGAVGGNGTSTAGGAGGAGSASSITGSSVTYAGGGGGGTYSGGTGGAGGSGGGTAGNSGSAASANTGSGGGGGRNAPVVAGGAGGSGVVILSIPTARYSGTTTGSPTVTTSGSNTILRYTGSGTYTA